MDTEPPPQELGGEAACLLHLVGDDGPDPPRHGQPLRIDLASLPTGGRPGVRWSLPHGGDLDANLVRLGPEDDIGDHVNGEVDVLVVGHDGGGTIVVDDRSLAIRAGVVVWVPRGARRAIIAGPDGLSYLSIHRARPGLSVGPRRDLADH